MSKLDILKAVAGAVLFVPVFYAWLVLILAMQP
jgi:hypothetical protein